jgi:hypothetical protein
VKRLAGAESVDVEAFSLSLEVLGDIEGTLKSVTWNGFKLASSNFIYN